MGHISETGARRSSAQTAIGHRGSYGLLCVLAVDCFSPLGSSQHLRQMRAGYGLPASVALLAMLGCSVAGLVGWRGGCAFVTERLLQRHSWGRRYVCALLFLERSSRARLQHSMWAGCFSPWRIEGVYRSLAGLACFLRRGGLDRDGDPGCHLAGADVGVERILSCGRRARAGRPAP